jgi:signal transduction histidine kinase
MTPPGEARSPESTQPGGRTLAQWRHDLRTPINHLIGYSEMILEDADDLSETLTSGLQTVHAQSTLLLNALQHALAPSGEDSRSVDWNGLQSDTNSDVQRIETTIAGLLATAATDFAEHRSDLERMASAVDAFRRLLDSAAQSLEASTSSASPSPEGSTEAGPVDESTSMDDSQAVPQPGDEAPLVLVVDDQASNRDLLSRRLRRDGLRTLSAAGGAEALATLRDQPVDLVLLDVLMPDVDGYEVLRRMKREPTLAHVPVVMISALEEIQSVVRCIELGAEDYLPKPFNPVLLRARVNACLEKKKLRDREQQQTRELKEALQQLEATKDQLVMQERLASLGALTAGIAHEIKNPLNFVNNFAQLSVGLVEELREILKELDQPATDEKREEIEELLSLLETNVQRIGEHGKRADGIIAGMLLHSRGGKGDRQPTELNSLVREFAGLAHHGLRVKDPEFNVELITEFDPSVGKVDVVAQDLSRVFLNIVNNACYAANERKKDAPSGFVPEVRVTTRRQGDRVEIRIADNGKGISQANLQKIFEPFFTTKPTGSGTGLGLSISRDILVKGHQGDLRAESREGAGATFILTLPAPPVK